MRRPAEFVSASPGNHQSEQEPRNKLGMTGLAPSPSRGEGGRVKLFLR